MWYTLIHDTITLIVEVAILYYVAAEYYSSIRLEDKLAERLRRRKAIVKSAPPAESVPPSTPV